MHAQASNASAIDASRPLVVEHVPDAGGPFEPCRARRGMVLCEPAEPARSWSARQRRLNPLGCGRRLRWLLASRDRDGTFAELARARLAAPAVTSIDVRLP